MNERAQNKVQNDIERLLSDHSRWAQYNLICYQCLVFLSVASSLFAGAAAIYGANRFIVAGAAILPVIITSIQKHVDFKRRLRWNNEYIRKLRRLNVESDYVHPIEMSKRLEALCEKLDSPEYDPDNPPIERPETASS